MPILILAVVMFFAMVLATAYALGTENKKHVPLKVGNRHYRY